MGFEAWLDDHLRWLLRLATALSGRPDLAEDLVQDVVIRVHRGWDAISVLEHREAYVRRMLVNEHLSWRRKWSRVVPRAEFVDRPDGRPGLAEQVADRAELRTSMLALPARQRAVVVLRYGEGLTDAEIAAALGCSPGTVRSHASRALATLRVTLRTAEEEDSHA